MAERRGRHFVHLRGGHFVHLSESLLSKRVENGAKNRWPTFQRSTPSLKTGPKHWRLFNPIQIGLTHGPTKWSSVENFSIPFEWDWQPRYMPNGGKEIRWPMKTFSIWLLSPPPPPLFYSQFSTSLLVCLLVLVCPPFLRNRPTIIILAICYSSILLS